MPRGFMRLSVLVVALTLCALLGVETAAAGWRYPRLRLAVGEVDGRILVGAQAWAPNPCYNLVGWSGKREIRIRGMREPEPSGDYSCPAVVVADWEAVRVRPGWTSIRVRYRDRTGYYAVRVSDSGVRTRFKRGSNVAPAEVLRWWHVPEDVLIAHVWYGKPEAIERVSDYVDDRLRERGATTFDTPDGWVIAEASPNDAPGDSGKFLARELTEKLRRDYRDRIYLSDLGRKALRRIANDAAQTERCTYVSLRREPLTDGVTGRPPCDKD